MSEPRPPSLLVTVLIVPAIALVVALTWYAEWMVLQGYPPLRITSVALGVAGALGLVGGVAMRRWMWAQQARRHQAGMPELAPSPRPTVRDWLVSGLYGLLVMPIVTGTQNLAITKVPLAMVVIAAMAGTGWRLVLVRRLRRPTALLAAALSAAALVALGAGPDAGTTELMIALLLVAPLVSEAGKLGWRAAVTSPGNQLLSIALLVAAVVLQIAGIARGEVFGDAPLGSTLALGALALLVPALVALMVIGHRGHPAAVKRSGAAMLLVVLLLGDACCGQTIAAATWFAAALTLAAILLAPPLIGEQNVGASER